jgi:predicted histidine transporter YuiF (NhaC family)
MLRIMSNTISGHLRSFNNSIRPKLMRSNKNRRLKRRRINNRKSTRMQICQALSILLLIMTQKMTKNLKGKMPIASLEAIVIMILEVMMRQQKLDITHRKMCLFVREPT